MKRNKIKRRRVMKGEGTETSRIKMGEREDAKKEGRERRGGKRMKMTKEGKRKRKDERER